MTSIGVIKMIDNHLYIPTTRLHKEKRKRKGSDYRVYTFKETTLRPFVRQTISYILCFSIICPLHTEQSRTTWFIIHLL